MNLSDGNRREGAGLLRSVHVIAGLEAVYGGPSYSVPRLCEALGAAGVQTTLLSVTRAFPGTWVSDECYADN